MIEKMASNLVDKIISEQLINEVQKEYYIYACSSIIERTITIGTICVMGFITNTFVYTVFFLLFFLALRKRTGGYHTSTFVKCYLGTVISYILVSKISYIGAEYPKLVLGTLLVAICIIEIIGTVNHPNMNMNMAELSETKRKSRILVSLEGSIIFFLRYVDADMILLSYMSTAIILCATLLCIAKIINQEVKGNETN